MYFYFSEPTDSSKIIAVAHGKNYYADSTSETFVELIGKKAPFDMAAFRK